MKKGRKYVDRPIPRDMGGFCLNERPEGMSQEQYREMRKLQNKILKLYLSGRLAKGTSSPTNPKKQQDDNTTEER